MDRGGTRRGYHSYGLSDMSWYLNLDTAYSCTGTVDLSGYLDTTVQFYISF
eukprot:SAG31_NODE_700_length_12734_cov_212.705105_9_plen_51_part_00